MTELSFEVIGSRPEPYAATPTLMLRLRITEADGQPVHAVALKCQVRIEPQRRHYDTGSEQRLYDVFGTSPQWGSSLRPFLWTHISTTVTSFVGQTEIDLPVECTYDFEVAGTKYLHALRDGEIPLLLLFSGTAFIRGTSGFVAEPVTWNGEAAYRLPVADWRATMDLYFPNGGWIRVGSDILDALSRYRSAQALPTWDLTLERLLKEAGEEAYP
ncbi:MAG: DUF6084 family protein [Acidimicrobiales bacterium]